MKFIFLQIFAFIQRYVGLHIFDSLTALHWLEDDRALEWVV